MRLSAKVIKNYWNVNSFQHGDQWMIRAGEPNTLYFQLVDLDQESHRYIPGIGVLNQPATVQVIFPSIDSDAVITANATAVDSADGSLWKVDLAADEIPGSGNVRFVVTEGSTARKFSVLNLMAVEYPDNDGSC